LTATSGCQIITKSLRTRGGTENPLAPSNIRQNQLTLIGGKYGEGRRHLMLPGGLRRVSRSRGRRIEGRRHIHVARHGIGGGGGGQLLAPVQLLQLGGQGARAAEAHGRRQEVAHEGGGGGGRALLLARTVQHRVVLLHLLLLLLLLLLVVVVVQLVRAAVAKARAQAQGWVVAVFLKGRMIMI